MHFVFNKENNSTVLVALMDGGVIASFVIDQNYYMSNPRQEKKDPIPELPVLEKQ